MFRVLASACVSIVIDGPLRESFRREHLAIPIDAGGALSLVRLCAQRKVPSRGAVLLVHGFGMNCHTWHLSGRSFAAFLAHIGYDVYVLELRGVGRSNALGATAANHLDQHILEDLPMALSVASIRSGHPKVTIIGHSMGALVTYCAMPDLAERIAAVITISGLFTFESGSRLLRLALVAGRRARLPDRWQRAPLSIRHIGRLLANALQIVDSRAALLLMPAQAWYPRGMERDLLIEQLQLGWDRGSVGVFLALLRVGKGARVISRTGRYYLREMATVDVPLLVVAAEQDTLLPPEDAKVAYTRSMSSDKTYMLFGPKQGHVHYGHLDIILGRLAPREVWPEIAAWLDARTPQLMD